MGLAGIGSAESPTLIPVPSQEPPATITPEARNSLAIFDQARILFRNSPVEFAQNFPELISTGLNALKYVVAQLSTYGSSGLNIDLESEALPQLDLSVARLKLSRLAEASAVDNPPAFQLQTAQNRLTIHRETNVTVIGETNGQILVSFSDNLRSDNSEFIALVKVQELTQLLEWNGYYMREDAAGKLKIFNMPGNFHELQTIKDEGFIQEIKQEMGAVFVDYFTGINLEETSVKFPVVPHIDKALIQGKTLANYQVSPDGKTVTAVDATGAPLAIATYNEKATSAAEAWEWKKYEAPLKSPEQEVEDWWKTLKLTPKMRLALEPTKPYLVMYLKEDRSKLLPNNIIDKIDEAIRDNGSPNWATSWRSDNYGKGFLQTKGIIPSNRITTQTNHPQEPFIDPDLVLFPNLFTPLGDEAKRKVTKLTLANMLIKEGDVSLTYMLIARYKGYNLMNGDDIVSMNDYLLSDKRGPLRIGEALTLPRNVEFWTMVKKHIDDFNFGHDDQKGVLTYADRVISYYSKMIMNKDFDHSSTSK